MKFIQDSFDCSNIVWVVFSGITNHCPPSDWADYILADVGMPPSVSEADFNYLN